MAQPETPCALEFLDGDAVRLAQNYRDCGLRANAGALLLINVDGAIADIVRIQQAVADAAAGSGLLELHAAQNAAEAEALWAARKALSPALRQLAPKKVNEDVVVPVSRLPELVAGIGEISKRNRLLIVCFGHAGNGNIHVNLLADPDDPAQMCAIENSLHEVFRLVLSLQGTLSGEHGVGIDKRDFVGWEIDATTLALMHSIKRVFDPRGILNPGKALPSF
jgi:D-lactate dehydrogenase